VGVLESKLHLSFYVISFHFIPHTMYSWSLAFMVDDCF